MIFSKNAPLPIMPRLAANIGDQTPAKTGAPNGNAPAAALAELPSQVVAAGILAPIDNWEFAERVWVGLRPHLRTRLWVLNALQTRAALPGPGGDADAERLKQLATEIQGVQNEAERLLRHRTSLAEFCSLLEHRLAPCLGQLERLQEALHERHGA